MKKTVLILFSIVLMQIAVGCLETNDGTFTEPITIYEKMGGTWALTKLTLTDEIAAASAIDPDAMDLTNKLNFKTFNLVLNLDESLAPTTFEVEGNSPELFLKSGYWDLSNAFPNTDATAVKLQLYSDASKTDVIDSLNINALPGRKAVLDIALVRQTNDIPYLTYQYSLKLQ